MAVAVDRRTLLVGIVGPGWVAAALLVAVGPTLATVPTTLHYLPLVASALVLGLPHGAVDHLALPRARSRPVTPAALARVGALYLVVGGAYAVCWALAPAPAFGLFIALTWAHWGQGDVHALVELVGVDHLRTRRQRFLTALVRGGLPMLVPLLAFPEWYRAVALELVGLFGPPTLGVAGWLFTAEARLVLGAAFAALTVGTLALGMVRATDRRGVAVDAGETALLWAAFLTAPSVFAIGVYFCLWHALRHLGRLALVDDRAAAALADGRLGPALARVGRDALPLTLAALLLLVGWYRLVPASPTDVPGVVAVYLALVAVLTAPHVVVVALMDRAERVWRPGGGSQPSASSSSS
jgi:Brp/Blh family beta-carotene 15,15'-monooxygenase